MPGGGTELIFTLAASRLEWLQIHNAGQCLEFDAISDRLVRNPCKRGLKSQQFIWDYDSTGDLIQSMADGDQCVTVHADAIPPAGGCPPKNTPLILRKCEWGNAYQQWHMDNHKRVVFSNCPHLCMAYHSSSWIYQQKQQSRMFAWPCRGAKVPFIVHRAMLGERNSSSDVELHNSNVFTENVTEGEAKIEVQKGYKPPPGSGGWQNVVEHWDDFSWKQRLGKIRTWQVAHMSEVLKEEGEEEMQQKYALRKQILPPGTALELLALCASVAISLSLLITLVGRAIFAHRWTFLNDDGCRNYEDGCSNQYDGWLAVPTEEGEWALDAEEAHQCGRRAMLVSASE